MSRLGLKSACRFAQLYDKLNHVEPGTSRALVQHTAKEARELIDSMKGGCTPLLKGYNIRILDGNHLGKTEHRLAVLRGTSAGALPGQSLVLLDPQRMIIVDIFPCEDAHAQERSLLEQISAHHPTTRPADRRPQLLHTGFPLRLDARCASFITRQHGRMPWKPVGKARYIGRMATGRVYQQTIKLCDPTTGQTKRVRRVTVKLNAPRATATWRFIC